MQPFANDRIEAKYKEAVAEHRNREAKEESCCHIIGAINDLQEGPGECSCDGNSYYCSNNSLPYRSVDPKHWSHIVEGVCLPKYYSENCKEDRRFLECTIKTEIVVCL